MNTEPVPPRELTNQLIVNFELIQEPIPKKNTKATIDDFKPKNFVISPEPISPPKSSPSRKEKSVSPPKPDWDKSVNTNKKLAN